MSILPIETYLKEMLTKSENMWDGHFGSIQALHHQIDREKKDSPPVPLAPYRTGPEAKEFKNQVIDRMIALDVIKRVQAERPSEIVFVPRKD